MPGAVLLPNDAQHSTHCSPQRRRTAVEDGREQRLELVAVDANDRRRGALLLPRQLLPPPRLLLLAARLLPPRPRAVCRGGEHVELLVAKRLLRREPQLRRRAAERVRGVVGGRERRLEQLRRELVAVEPFLWGGGGGVGGVE